MARPNVCQKLTLEKDVLCGKGSKDSGEFSTFNTGGLGQILHMYAFIVTRKSVSHLCFDRYQEAEPIKILTPLGTQKSYHANVEKKVLTDVDNGMDRRGERCTELLTGTFKYPYYFPKLQRFVYIERMRGCGR
ncbi:hypothetical protein C0992_003643 [Termitomyces sp. T32_za158]|nr:hypothetical protein C0992_003643 [Termitomyces sp. T32_za158]